MKSLDEENESRHDFEFLEAETAGSRGKRKAEITGSRGKRKAETTGSRGKRKAETTGFSGKREPVQLSEENAFEKTTEPECPRPSSLPTKLTKANLGVANESFIREDSDSQEVNCL